MTKDERKEPGFARFLRSNSGLSKLTVAVRRNSFQLMPQLVSDIGMSLLSLFASGWSSMALRFRHREKTLAARGCFGL